MHSQVRKWGNSLGVRIPKILAQKLHLTSGSDIELRAEDQRIIISKTNSELDNLLDGINSTNCHSEKFEDDENMGSESW
jgi:antitoxin MazE